MVRAYNEVYRRSLRKKGIPTRRELAEAVLQAVVEEAMASEPEHAKRTLGSAAAILRSVMTPSNQPIFNNDGIKTRIKAVADAMKPQKANSCHQQSAD